MFTKNQIQEIANKLGLLGKKDTDFDEAKLPLTGDEWIVLVQNGKNVKTKVKNLGVNFQPDDPNDPENPGEPSDPDTPDIPDIPDTPDDPDVPTYDPPKLYVNPKKWNVESIGGTLEVHLDPRNADESTLSVISIADDIRCERVSNTRIFNVTMPENKTGNVRYDNIIFSVVGLDGTTVEAALVIEQAAFEVNDGELVPKITLNKVAPFLWDEINIDHYFTGTFENCIPLRGVSTENYSLNYEGPVSGNTYKFKVSLSSNNYSTEKTYSGKIDYQRLDGTVDYVYVSINVGSAPAASVIVSPSTLNFPYTGGTFTVGVGIQNAYPNATLKVDNNHHGFLTITEIAKNTYTVTALPNDRVTEKGGDINFTITGLNGKSATAVLTVKIAAKPTSEDEEPDTEQLYMYRGYLNADLANEFGLLDNGLTGIFNKVNGDAMDRGIEMGIITKEPLEEKGKTLFPDTPRDTVLIFAIPHSSTMNVYIDDGIGNQSEFNHSQVHVNGETIITIGNEAYRLYGEYQSNPIGDTFAENNQGVLKYYYIN